MKLFTKRTITVLSLTVFSICLTALLFGYGAARDSGISKDYEMLNPGREVVDIWTLDGDLSLVDVCIIYVDSSSGKFGGSIVVYRRDGWLDWRLIKQEDTAQFGERPASYSELLLVSSQQRKSRRPDEVDFRWPNGTPHFTRLQPEALYSFKLKSPTTIS